MFGLGVVEVKSKNGNLLLGSQLDENDAKRLTNEIKKMVKGL